MRAREIIEANVRPHPPVGKRKSGEGKVDQRWRQLLDAYPTSAGTAENAQGRGEPDR